MQLTQNTSRRDCILLAFASDKVATTAPGHTVLASGSVGVSNLGPAVSPEGIVEAVVSPSPTLGLSRHQVRRLGHVGIIAAEEKFMESRPALGRHSKH